MFLGTSRGPCWWEIDKGSHEVTPRGLIFTADHPLSASTAEGWYWDWKDADILYCSDDKHLYRYDFATYRYDFATQFDHATQDLEVVVDITPFAWLGQFALRQWHTGGKRHSATVFQIVDDGPWPAIGTVVYEEGKCQPWRWFQKIGANALDESQVDRSGKWLGIKETPPGHPGEDDRIISLIDGEERLITDQDGAPGHSDSGYGYIVGADNQEQLATWRLWPCDSLQSRVILTTSWDAQVLHVSHCNARPGAPAKQWVLGSGTLSNLITFPLDGSMHTRAIAPSMSAGTGYDDLPKASLDPHGEYALWTRRDGRFDAFMVKIPA